MTLTSKIACLDCEVGPSRILEDDAALEAHQIDFPNHIYAVVMVGA